MSTTATPAPDPRRPRSHLASTLKHGGVYALGTVLSRLAAFIMLPIYTRVLSTEEYGVLEVLVLSTDIVSMLAGLGVRQAVVRFYYLYETDEDRNAVIGSAGIMLFAMFGTVGLLGIAFAVPITEVLLGADQSALFVRLAMVGLVAAVLGDLPGVYLQARQRSAENVLANLARLVVGLSLNVLFVVYLRMGVAGIFYSSIAASVLVGGVMTLRTVRETGLPFSPRIAREMIRFGMPLMAAQLSGFVLHFSDRYFLRYFHGLAVVGLYSLSYKLAMLIPMFVAGPFGSIWAAKALEISKTEGEAARPILRDIMRKYNLALVSAALLVALFSSDVIQMMLGEQFFAADYAIPPLALAMVFFGYREITQLGSTIARKSSYIAISRLVAAVAVTGMNLLLIPMWGAMGAAAATAAAFALEGVVMWRFSEHAHPLGVELSDVLPPLFIAFAMWCVAVIATPEDSSQLRGISTRALAVVLYGILLNVTGVVTSQDRAMLARLLRNPVRAVRELREA